MSRILGLLCLFLAPGFLGQVRAAIWPDQWGSFQKSSTRPVTLSSQPVWDEYGLEQSEQAHYKHGSQEFTATAWRLKDPTGAYSAFEWLRPRKAFPSKLANLAAETSDGVLLAYGNYLFQFQGIKPRSIDLVPLLNSLVRLDQSSVPTLGRLMPFQSRKVNSERYILGPASLEAFEPRIPPSVAAFHLGAEGQLAVYQAKGGDLKVLLFAYPTPQMARERLVEFQKLPGALAKRSGPLVAITLSPPDADAAERMLAQINYRASITLDELPPDKIVKNFSRDILTIFKLAGLLIVFCLVAGLGFAAIRLLAQKFGGSRANDSMILLHLGEK